jgi:hypothetical protein
MYIGIRINYNIDDSYVHSVPLIFSMFSFYEKALTNIPPFVIDS